MQKNNVIPVDFRTQKKKSQSETKGKTTSQSHIGEILDISTKREEIIVEERRQVKRTILTEFIGAWIVIPDHGLQRAMLHDISDSGLAFDIPAELGTFTSGEEVAMRVYLNQQTYFPFSVVIQNSRFIEYEHVYRHGTNFVKGTVNDQALFHFIKFIENVAAGLERDNGDVMVSKIKT
jgi:hypothetical protein